MMPETDDGRVARLFARILIAFGALVLVTVLIDTASADNCSSEADCQTTGNYTATVAVGGGAIAVGAAIYGAVVGQEAAAAAAVDTAGTGDDDRPDAPPRVSSTTRIQTRAGEWVTVGFDQNGVPIDENGERLDVTDGTEVDDDGLPVPAGRVVWETPDGTRYLTPDEAAEQVAWARQGRIDREGEIATHERETARMQEEWRERLRDEEREAQERIREREAQERRNEEYLRRREELERQLERDEAEARRLNDPDEIDRATWEEGWEGVVKDVDRLSELASYDTLRDAGIATRDVLDRIAEEATDPENWRVLGETAYDTVGDVVRIAAGDRETIQETAENVRRGAEAAARAAQAAAQVAAHLATHPVETIEMFTGIQDLRDAMDPDIPVERRIGHVLMAWGELAGTLLGGGAIAHADELVDAARAADRIEDIGDAARAAERIEDIDDISSAVRTAERSTDVTGGARIADGLGDSNDAVRAADNIDATSDGLRGMPMNDGSGRIAQSSEEAQELLRSRNQAWDDLVQGAEKDVDDYVAARRELDAALASGDKTRIDAALDANKEAALRVQGNKQALQRINNRTVDVQAGFNNEMRQIYDAADDKVLDWARHNDDILRQAGVDKIDDLEFVGTGPMHERIYRDPTTGVEFHIAEPTNPSGGIKVGADRDYTLRVKPPDGTPIDIDHRMVEPEYNRAFYEAAGGDEMATKIGLDADPDAFSHRMDQAITDRLHREAYGKGPKDLAVILGRPDVDPSDIKQIGEAMGYKGDHWFELAEHSRQIDPEAAEDFMAEGYRQLTKQFDNQIAGKLDEFGNVDKQGRLMSIQDQVADLQEAGRLPPDYSVKMDPRLEAAIDEMRQVQAGTKSPADVEAALRQMNMTPRDVSARMSDYMEGLSKLAPSPLRDLRTPGV